MYSLTGKRFWQLAIKVLSNSRASAVLCCLSTWRYDRIHENRTLAICLPIRLDEEWPHESVITSWFTGDRKLDFHDLPKGSTERCFCFTCKQTTNRTAYPLCGEEDKGPPVRCEGFEVSVCNNKNCRSVMIWHEGKLEYPPYQSFDLLENITPSLPLTIYKNHAEAGMIFLNSPRSAGLLLRAALQLFCSQLSCPGTNLTDDITALIQKGLPKVFGDSLLNVCLTEGRSLYPPTLNEHDTPETIRNFHFLFREVVMHFKTHFK